jgi:hypothetical protein
MMGTTKKRTAKVIPLKTTAQLRADNILMKEELDAAREQVGQQQATMDRMAAAYGRQKDDIARILVDVRNALQEEPVQGRLPFRTRLMTMGFPKFMLRQAARGSRSAAWAKILVRLNEYNFQRHHEAVHTTATTLKAGKPGE